MTPCLIEQNEVTALPITHYNMEMAALARLAYEEVKPDCVAVELAETMQLQLLHGASRLPDLSVIIAYDTHQEPIYYLVEPCDPAFEGLRSALEDDIPAFCIDLDIDAYPIHHDLIPDPFAITKIGHQNYFEEYDKMIPSREKAPSTFDHYRELYMAKRLKELSLSYDRILFISGMHHTRRVLDLINRSHFPSLKHAERDAVQVCTLTEESSREVMGEIPWITNAYENTRGTKEFPPDRQRLLIDLFKEGAEKYTENTGFDFPGYHLRNLMKYARNYSLVTGRLMPTFFQILSVAKGCVDHNYAYEVWEQATDYPHLKNVDGLDELDLDIEDVWGKSKKIHFHLKEKNPKSFWQKNKIRKDRKQFQFEPPGPFSICSYQPEDIVIENFGRFLKKKGEQLASEEGARSIPFSSSIEDGIDTRETIRHWPEKKLYVKVKGKPPGGVGSIVMIFDEDKKDEDHDYLEKYPWKMTWLGEHEQESDMAFYSTRISENVVGPGISRCLYGGMMLTYPPRRVLDVWTDPDYQGCRSKSEVLLMAAIDYSVDSLIIYVAEKPPRQALKSYARKFGKKVIYLPIGQLSPVRLKKIQVFHVLDGHHRRKVADEYID